MHSHRLESQLPLGAVWLYLLRTQLKVMKNICTISSNLSKSEKWIVVNKKYLL